MARLMTDSDRRYDERWKVARQTGNYTESQLKWLGKRKEWNRNYYKRRKQENPTYRISCNIRNRMRNALIRATFKKTQKLNKYTGCSMEELKIYLEQQFDEKMSWENYGSYWSIDHILPLSLAENEEELYKLSHYLNLRPLSNIDNHSKNGRMSEEDISLYLSRINS